MAGERGCVVWRDGVVPLSGRGLVLHDVGVDTQHAWKTLFLIGAQLELGCERRIVTRCSSILAQFDAMDTS